MVDTPTSHGEAAALMLAARLEAGLSQRALADLAGTSGATIAAYELGTKEPRLSTLRRIVEAAGMDLEWRYRPAVDATILGLTREDRRSLALHRVIAARLLADPEAGVDLSAVAIDRGIAALATSAGLGEEPAFDEAAEAVLDWITENRGSLDTLPDMITNIITPTCAVGEIRGVMTTVTASDLRGRSPLVPDLDCSVEPASPPADDVDAFLAGYIVIAPVPSITGG